MKQHTLLRSIWIGRPLPEVFEFFADATNLELLTPPSLRFQIMTPAPIEMSPGARIDYRLTLSGVPVRWRTRISVWEPGSRFVDEQERGPYALWRHLHTFEPEAGGTRMRDEVTYALPLGPLGEVAHRLWVKRQLARIFDYREQVIVRVLQGGAHAPAPGERRVA